MSNSKPKDWRQSRDKFGSPRAKITADQVFFGPVDLTFVTTKNTHPWGYGYKASQVTPRGFEEETKQSKLNAAMKTAIATLTSLAVFRALAPAQPALLA